MVLSETTLESMRDAARAAQANAYCPYSGYAVGAAVLSATGRLFTGANVENLSYGATLCAERNAIGQMVASGESEIAAVLVFSADGVTPCGICRQVIAEFVRDPHTAIIACATPQGIAASYSFANLFPHGFASDLVNRTENPANTV